MALCLVWANHDCEIATLNEKYLRLSGTIDPVTREWHVKDRAKLDTLLQSAATGAREGIAFAEKAEVDPAVLAMIYERASNLAIQNDDASALEALRNYWRCALLGNMCWQLAHTHKAQPVDISTDKPPTPPVVKPDDKEKPSAATTGNPPAINSQAGPSVVAVANPPTPAAPPAPPAPPTPAPPAVNNPAANAEPPVAPVVHDSDHQPTPAPFR